MTADISIVVGSQNAKSTIGACLTSVLEQSRGRNAQILVADSSHDGTQQIIAEQFPTVTLLRAGEDKLVPHLWGIGMERAEAPIVALTTAHCIPRSDWIETILSRSSQRECAGLGGPISAPETGSPVDWAVYFSRYSAFMPPAQDGCVADVPGDNAAYRKDALDRCWHNRDNGFWETLFHHELRNNGEHLYMIPDVQVRLGHTDSAWDYFNVRYQHGFHYGSTRPGTRGVTRILRVLTAPLLLPYLVGRIGRRVAQRRPDWLPQYAMALPWLLFFTLGWSLGETAGYLKMTGNGNA